ncbi:nitrate/nitrite transporter [Salibacterium qingdaonense]|uniref:MFS transporter, NNP family, nitrate/nitrite transporter n=1 Tax=Salibacterium qingdaonense TaxID=266892 RepID=A0A1I4ME53_9BACI|nr:MFS transporter [Salibacterium qingdaonense]SFM01296.1 MFS transporter, NNP family, nitrate/nitrite transporter [Salibacterium qingdaonense]
MEQKRAGGSLLLLTTIGMTVAFMVWGAFSPLINQIGETYNLSATEKSVLAAVPVLLGSVMRVPLGILTEKYGGRKVYTLLLLFLIVPLTAAGFVDSYAALLVCAFFLGMAGTSFAVSMTFVSKWTSKEKQGTALGINALGNAGTAAASLALPMIALAAGLEWVFWSLILPIAAMAVLLWFFTPETPSADTSRTVKGELSVLTYKHTWTLSLFYFVTFGIFVTFSVYLPTLLTDVFDLSAVDAGRRTAGFIILATFIRPLGGFAADKLAPGPILAGVFLTVAAGGAGIAIGGENMMLMTAASLLLAAASGVGNGAVFKMVPSIFPSATGTVTGIVGAAGGLGGFFPPILLGVVRDMTGAYAIGFLLLAVMSTACFLVNQKAFLKNKKEQNLKEVQV